jgi:hypothetical protein
VVIESGKSAIAGIRTSHLVQPVLSTSSTLIPATLDVVRLLDELLCGTWDVADEDTLGFGWVPVMTSKAVLTECEPALFSVHGRR